MVLGSRDISTVDSLSSLHRGPAKKTNHTPPPSPIKPSTVPGKQVASREEILQSNHYYLDQLRKEFDFSILTERGIQVDLMSSEISWEKLYRKRKFLGSGTYADVYQNYDSTQRQTVALKVLRLDKFGMNHHRRVTKMIKNEIISMAKSQCPNVVTLHRLIVCSNAWVLEMAYSNGGTLWAKRKTQEFAFLELVQILQGLMVIHKEGIVHRDLKPTNILRRTGDHWIFICDFGWSEDISKLKSPSNPKEWPGTLEINPPEVIRYDLQEQSEKLDFYALGLNLMLLLWGKFVCRPKGTKGMKAAHAIQEVIAKLRKEPPPTGFEEDSWKVFLGLTKSRPVQRWGVQNLLNSRWFLDEARRDLTQEHNYQYIWHPDVKTFLQTHMILKTPSLRRKHRDGHHSPETESIIEN